MRLIGSMSGIENANDWARVRGSMPKSAAEAKAFAARMNARNATRVRVEVDVDDPGAPKPDQPAETPAQQQNRIRRQKNAASWDRAFARAAKPAASWDRAFAAIGAKPC